MVSNMLQKEQDLGRIENLKALREINIIGNPLWKGRNVKIFDYIYSKMKRPKIINCIRITSSLKAREGKLSENDLFNQHDL